MNRSCYTNGPVVHLRFHKMRIANGLRTRCLARAFALLPLGLIAANCSSDVARFSENSFVSNGSRALPSELRVPAQSTLSTSGPRNAEPRVILLRGWFGVFSTGLDSLTERLRARGINAELSRHLSWYAVVSGVLQERAAGKTGQLVLVGHFRARTTRSLSRVRSRLIRLRLTSW